MLYPLDNWEIANYFNYNPRFNDVFSRNNFRKIKNGAYVINRDDKKKKSKGTHWISLFIDKNVAVYFDFFRIECIPQEVLNKIRGKPITHNMTRDNECAMDGSYCIAFIEYIIAEKLC